MKNPLNWIIKDSLEKTEDYYEKSRLNLTFRIWLALTSFFIILAIVMVIFNDDLGTIYLIGIGLLILVPVGYCLNTNKVKIAANIISFIGVILVSVGIFTFNNPMPLDGGLWLLIFCIYAYFSLGLKTGNLLFFTSIITYSFYLIFRLPDNLALFKREEITVDKVVILVSMIVIIFLIIRHIVIEFVKTKNEAEQSFKEINSELIYQNKVIESQNEEKTLMMREIHHRVKNNLQVINSLLRIQANKLNDDKTKDVFNDAQNRVIAMALIHEEMYKNNSLDKVEVQNYISNLSKEILANNSPENDIKIKIHSELEFIHNKKMVSLGLIVNELIINSIKHGFRGFHKSKDIEITFTCDCGNECQGNPCLMIYKDNGVGFEMEDINTETSFGMEMVEALSEQLDGALVVKNAQVGVEMHLQFDCSV